MIEIEPMTIFYGGLVLIFIVLLIILIFTGKEGFDPSYVTDKETYIKSSEVTSDPILSNGTVQKYKDENGNYVYQGYFNLPRIGSEFQVSQLDKPFNAPLEEEKYRVMLDDVLFVGNLERQSNGYHTFSYSSPQNHKKACVYIGSSLIGCANL